MRGGANAAIWFSADGYNPLAKGINGRRMAGESFLRGYFRHADVTELVGLAHSTAELKIFAGLAAQHRPDIPVRGVRLDEMQKLAPTGTIFYSAPGIAPECWRRAPHGGTRYSICGITHTTASKAVMDQVWALRMAPQMEWDAIICTSRAVRSAVEVQMDLIDAQISERFRAPPPPRPQLPVIPLGVHCDDFEPSASAGSALRKSLGLTAGDVLCLTVARLSPHGKFDPLPMYLALAQAQAALRSGTRLHMVLCGSFSDHFGRDVFTKGAAALMPNVPLHHLDKADNVLRHAALSAADIFLFPIDNIQEAFGIAPVEAMAAGLPVIASDWDGLRDTVTPETGILIPTEAVRPGLVALAGQRHLGGTDSFIQYLTQVSAVTRVDVGAMARAIQVLAEDADLRKRLGAAGQRRARGLYDWGHVIARMQGLWGELADLRGAVDPARFPPLSPERNPVGPSPTALFASYPSRIFAPGARRYVAIDTANRPSARETMVLRNYIRLGRLFELPDHVQMVADVLTTQGGEGADLAHLSRATGFPEGRVERILIWLLKYHFAREHTDD